MSLCAMPYEHCDEEADFWIECKRTARKPHKCVECCQEIPVGMDYGIATSLYDGRWWTQRRCASCLILAEWVATVTGYCPLWGGLDDSVDNANYEHQTYDEERDEYSRPLPDPLTYRRQWDAADEAGRIAERMEAATHTEEDR